MDSQPTHFKNDKSEHLEMSAEHDIETQASDKAAVPVSVGGYIPGSDEEKALVRKIDMYLLPMIFLMYLWSYMDRTNIGNAKVAGMTDDLHMNSGQYSVTLVVFFVGYVVFEVPSNMILARTRPSRFLPAIMFLWGCVTIAMGFIQNYETLLGLRIIVGILEAGFAPGVLLTLSSWYKKDEQSKRFAVYISAAILSGAFGGLLGGAITEGLEGAQGLRGWRWLFIVEGIATAVVSIMAGFVLLDFPANTKKFSARERELAIQRLLHDNDHLESEDQPTPTHLQALRMSLGNWKTWVFVVGYMAIVGSSTLSYFYPTLVQGLGYTSHMAQYMTIPIYVVAFVCTLTTAYFMDRAPHTRGLVLASWMTVAMVCSIITCAVYNLKARYALLVIMASGLWASNGLALSYVSSAFAAESKEVRAITLAFVNAMGNLAQIYGAYLFPSEEAPKYLKGFGVISGLCFTGVMSYLALHVIHKRWPVDRR